MALDPLADRLARLLADGSIIASDLSRPMRERLATLFKMGALVEEKAAGGRRVHLSDARALEAWIGASYPSGLVGTADALPPRAESVANFAHSKRGRSIAVRPVFMRGFGTTVLRRSSGVMPLAETTRKYGLTAVLIEPDDPWQLDGTIALVENLEMFLHVEEVLTGIDVALWTAGRFDQRVIEWLARMADVRVVHAGDYDPVGLDEYLRARASLGDRVTLFVPTRLAEYVARFGRADLLADSAAVLERVRKDGDEAVRAVIAVLDQHGKGLEQEALLVNVDER